MLKPESLIFKGKKINISYSFHVFFPYPKGLSQVPNFGNHWSGLGAQWPSPFIPPEPHPWRLFQVSWPTPNTGLLVTPASPVIISFYFLRIPSLLIRDSFPSLKQLLPMPSFPTNPCPSTVITQQNPQTGATNSVSVYLLFCTPAVQQYLRMETDT